MSLAPIPTMAEDAARQQDLRLGTAISALAVARGASTIRTGRHRIVNKGATRATAATTSERAGLRGETAMTESVTNDGSTTPLNSIATTCGPISIDLNGRAS